MQKGTEAAKGTGMNPANPASGSEMRRVQHRSIAQVNGNVGEHVSQLLTHTCGHDELARTVNLPPEFCTKWKSMTEVQKQACGRVFRNAGGTITDIKDSPTGLHPDDVVLCISVLSEGNTKFADEFKMRECVTEKTECHVLNVPVCKSYFDAVLTIAENPKVEDCREVQYRQALNLQRTGVVKAEILRDMLRGTGGDVLDEETVREKAVELHMLCDWGMSRDVRKGSANGTALMTLAETFFRQPAAARNLCNDANHSCENIIYNTLGSPVDAMCSMVQTATGNAAFLASGTEYQRSGNIVQEAGANFPPPYDTAFDKIATDCNIDRPNHRADVRDTLITTKTVDHRILCQRLNNAHGSHLPRMNDNVNFAIALSSY